MKIAVCGKGGSGKSIIVSLLALQAEARGLKVLVIDSDESNSGLFRLLGLQHPPVPLLELAGGKNAVKQKIGKSDIFSQNCITVEDIPAGFVVRQNGLRLVSIGKIMMSLEGCACPMGVLCRELLKKLAPDDDEMVIADMEAGVEHFGRGITVGIDAVLLVVEPSMESIDLAKKVRDLTAGIDKGLLCILNKVGSDAVSRELSRILKAESIEIAGIIPYDTEVFEACLRGQSIKRGSALQAAGSILTHLMQPLSVVSQGDAHVS